MLSRKTSAAVLAVLLLFGQPASVYSAVSPTPPSREAESSEPFPRNEIAPLPGGSETIPDGAQPNVPLIDRYLEEGELGKAEAACFARLAKNKYDDQARFALGMVQFLSAIEQLCQDFFRYGLRGFTDIQIPFLRLKVSANSAPETLTYLKARGIAIKLVANLNKAQTTLAGIKNPTVSLPLHFGKIKMNLTGHTPPSRRQPLWRLYGAVTGHPFQQEQAENFYIKFDRGDVHWLRGYCHLLTGLCEIYLAYNSKETFDTTAHLFFKKVQTPYPFLTNSVHGGPLIKDWQQISDFIALLHTIRWRVAEPKRMEAALHHFEQVVAQSKESWKWIMAETDDDHEWLPNPKQTGVFPNMHVTQEMVTGWNSMMAETGRIVAGERLIPFWRGSTKLGVNVRQVFLKPTNLDVVLWVQGTAAAPYLQKGRMADMKVFSNARSSFNGNFPGFALWFN